MTTARAPAARLVARLAGFAFSVALVACLFTGCGERVELGGSGGGAQPPDTTCQRATCGVPCTLQATACDHEPCPHPVMGSCDGRGMCVPFVSGLCRDPECEGKRCGDPCWTCPPGQTSCPPPWPTMGGETPRACDHEGRCASGSPPQCG